MRAAERGRAAAASLISRWRGGAGSTLRELLLLVPEPVQRRLLLLLLHLQLALSMQRLQHAHRPQVASVIRRVALVGNVIRARRRRRRLPDAFSSLLLELRLARATVLMLEQLGRLLHLGVHGHRECATPVEPPERAEELLREELRPLRVGRRRRAHRGACSGDVFGDAAPEAEAHPCGDLVGAWA
jgi:hypothetical protein